jgi:chemotaxis-related protein WspD
MPAIAVELPVVDDCWNRIGVKGDGSCVELAKVGHCHNCPVFAAAGQALLERCPPAEYLEEWTQRLGQDEEAAPTDTRAVLLFRLGEEWLAMDVRHAVEVAPARPARRIPHRSDRLLSGLVNIRGELHLCVSLRELLEIDSSNGVAGKTAPRLLVVEHRQQRWVFQVDEVLGVQRVPLNELGAVPSTVARRPSHFTRGVFDREGKSVGLIDEDRLFEALKRRIG